MFEVLFSLLMLIAVTGQSSENCAHCLDKGSIQYLIIGYDRAIQELCWDICEVLPDYPDTINIED